MRRGRKRKSGARKPSGDIVLRKVSVAEVAAGMPHRRALGDKAKDQLAENELGRMLLRGEIEDSQCRAGEVYRMAWRNYIRTLEAPKLARMVEVGSGAVSLRCERCTLDAVGGFCLCMHTRKEWDGFVMLLANSGATGVVDRVVLLDKPVGEDAWLLRLGLDVLANYCGLKGRPNRRNVGNAS